MVLHFFVNEKYTKDFIIKMNQLYKEEEHFFIVYNNENKYCTKKDLPYENVCFLEIRDDYSRIMKFYERSRMVIVHGLFFATKDLVCLYYMQRRYKKAIAWALWGADLYNEYRTNRDLKKTNIKLLIREWYRARFIRSLDMVITSNDYNQLKEWYKTQAIHVRARYVYQFFEPQEMKESIHQIPNVMIGHSATETCRHVETFEMLRDYVGRVKIYCPMSYPKDEAYVEKVEQAGKSIFGDDLIIMKEYMDYENYIKFLNQIDIGIFNNNRQQGMGNIINLLYLGKKVLLSQDNTLKETCSQNGLYICDLEDIKHENFFVALSENIRESNKEKIKYMYSDECFLELWNDIFARC